eukprot:gene1266-6931_t
MYFGVSRVNWAARGPAGSSPADSPAGCVDGLAAWKWRRVGRGTHPALGPPPPAVTIADASPQPQQDTAPLPTELWVTSPGCPELTGHYGRDGDGWALRDDAQLGGSLRPIDGGRWALGLARDWAMKLFPAVSAPAPSPDAAVWNSDVTVAAIGGGGESAPTGGESVPSEPARADAGGGLAKVSVHKIDQLRDAYDAGFAFPRWVRDGHHAFPLRQYDWGGVEAYYPAEGTTEAEARRTATEREP